MDFVLDPQLENDSFFLCDLALCQVRHMDDRRYPWLILVPRRADLTQLDQLSESERARLAAELDACSRALRDEAPVERVNVASLGNVVAQLHVHVIGRWPQDPAWPGPVWGHSPAVPFASRDQAARAAALRERLSR